MRLDVARLPLPWKRLLAELTVIVGGVLIALAVDSWSERRQEREQAEAYLEQLLMDFQETERRLHATIAEDTKTLEWSGYPGQSAARFGVRCPRLIRWSFPPGTISSARSRAR